MTEASNGEDESAQSIFNRLFATDLAFPDAPYVMVCNGCDTVYKRERDCKTTKAARAPDRDANCSKCGTELELVRDRQADAE